MTRFYFITLPFFSRAEKCWMTSYQFKFRSNITGYIPPQWEIAPDESKRKRNLFFSDWETLFKIYQHLFSFTTECPYKGLTLTDLFHGFESRALRTIEVVLWSDLVSSEELYRRTDQPSNLRTIGQRRVHVLRRTDDHWSRPRSRIRNRLDRRRCSRQIWHWRMFWLSVKIARAGWRIIWLSWAQCIHATRFSSVSIYVSTSKIGKR